MIRRTAGWALIPFLVVLALPTAVRLVGDYQLPVLPFVAMLAPISVPLLIAMLVAFLGLQRLVLATVTAALLALNVFWQVPLWVAEPAGGGTSLAVLTVSADEGALDAAAVTQLVTSQTIDVLVVTELTPEAVQALRGAGVEKRLPKHLLSPRPGPPGGIWSRFTLTKLPAWSCRTPLPLPDRRHGPQGHRPRRPHPERRRHRLEQRQRRHRAHRRRHRRRRSRCARGGGSLEASRDADALQTLLDAGVRDSAEASGSGWTPTWGSGPWLDFFALDHVLVDDGIGARSMRTYTVGADHRAVVAHLVVRYTADRRRPHWAMRVTWWAQHRHARRRRRAHPHRSRADRAGRSSVAPAWPGAVARRPAR